jgi:hypothetical protein
MAVCASARAASGIPRTCTVCWEGLRIGIPHVLAGDANHPSGGVERILSRLQQPGEPIERGVGIGVPQTLLQRGDEIEVLFSRLVVNERLPLDGFQDRLPADATDSVRPGGGHLKGQIERIQDASGIPRRPCHELGQRILAERRLSSQTSGVRYRAANNLLQSLLSQGPQDVDLQAREQSGIDGEGRILGGRADEEDRTRLDERKKRILLGPVEAMKLVDENESPLPRGPAEPLRGGHDFPNLLDAGEDRRKADERPPCGLAQEPGERRLPRAGGTPEDEGMKLAFLPCEPERPAFAEEIVLAENMGDIRRADPIGEGGTGRRGDRGVREEIHG